MHPVPSLAAALSAGKPAPRPSVCVVLGEHLLHRQLRRFDEPFAVSLSPPPPMGTLRQLAIEISPCVRRPIRPQQPDLRCVVVFPVDRRRHPQDLRQVCARRVSINRRREPVVEVLVEVISLPERLVAPWRGRNYNCRSPLDPPRIDTVEIRKLVIPSERKLPAPQGARKSRHT